MKYDIIIAGVGGQGTLSLATIVAGAALASGFQVKQTEVHGMAQKGGSVVSHLRLADAPIASDIIPIGAADLLIGVESLEAWRSLPYLSTEGWAIVSTTRILNMPHYPNAGAVEEGLCQATHLVMLDTEQLARDAGSVRAANTVVLGAASVLLPCSSESVEAAVSLQFQAKGERIVDANLKALRAGQAEMALAADRPVPVGA